VDREFVTLFMIFDENMSPYLDAIGACRGWRRSLNNVGTRRCPSTFMVAMCCTEPLQHPYRKEAAMDWNRIEGNWKQLKGKIKEKWGHLTDDDLDKIAGRREQLEGKIQERYGISKDAVRKDVDDWMNTLSDQRPSAREGVPFF
jgi:uncharacterized protein YjbJ (UPF0337 family)